MGDGSGSVVWFSAPGFVQLGVDDTGVELVVAVETTAWRVGCRSCGVIARSKDRRWVTVRDAPTSGDRPVLLRWRKRVWHCAEPACSVKTWTEQRPDFAVARHVLTVRAEQWVTSRVTALEGTPTSCARKLGVTWATTWSAVERHGHKLVDDPDRVGPTVQVGFDETVMSPARRRRRRRFISAVVDIVTGQILDIFDGRDAADLRRWLATQPHGWLDEVQVISVDPHEGYRSAITGNPLLDVTVVVDPFHIVRLANAAVTKCRQRTQQQTLGHRGWNTDPLFGVRKLLLMAAEHLDDEGWARLHDALRRGDPHDEVRDTWVAKEYVRDIYLANNRADAQAALERAIAWCTDTEAGPEQRTLAKTLRRWASEILAHHDTGASNGRVEAANLLIKAVKRAGRGFRSLENYRLRILLAGGLKREIQPVTRLRGRPRLIA